MNDLTASPCIRVSWGEVIDKISILRLKKQFARDAGALTHIETELRHLLPFEAAFLRHAGADAVVAQLHEVNALLWAVEDRIRELDRRRSFGPDFVQCAQSVYRTNDRRADLKRIINDMTGSPLVEQKMYGQ